MKVNLIFAVCILVILAIGGSCQSEQQLNYARYYTTGKALYEQHCQNCHSSDGSGLGDLIPPLTDSVFFKQNKEKLACIIRYGLNTPIQVNGKVYQEKMPSNESLAELDIAALITYITNSFGNKQGLYDVSKVTLDIKECD